MYGGDNHSCQQDDKVLTVNETIFKNITSTWQYIYLANVIKMLKKLPVCFNCSYLPSCFSGLESFSTLPLRAKSRDGSLLVMRISLCSLPMSHWISSRIQNAGLSRPGGEILAGRNSFVLHGTVTELSSPDSQAFEVFSSTADFKDCDGKVFQA